MLMLDNIPLNSFFVIYKISLVVPFLDKYVFDGASEFSKLICPWTSFFFVPFLDKYGFLVNHSCLSLPSGSCQTIHTYKPYWVCYI